jgi:hypothetical protein
MVSMRSDGRTPETGGREPPRDGVDPLGSRSIDGRTATPK